jgi:CheY-like chemotaxis protein
MKFEVLLVEDEQRNAEEIGYLLETALPGASVRRFMSHREAIDAIDEALREDRAYDVIVVDLNLPDNNDRHKTYSDLPTALRRAFPDASIIVCSAFLDESDPEQLTAAENIHIVRKPQTRNMIEPIMRDLGKRLLLRLRAALGRRGGERNGYSYSRLHRGGGCSTVAVNGVLDDIISIYRDLPVDIRDELENYVSITERDNKLWVDV